MTDLIQTNYVQFDNDIVVDTISGMPVGASQRGFARIVNKGESSIRDWVNSRCADFQLLTLEIHTAGGLQGARIIPFSAFKAGFKKFAPDLLEAASDYGITAYTLNLAGYKVEANPQPSLPTTRELALMVIAAEDRADALAAQIEADSEPTALGKSIQITSEHIRIGEFAKQIGMGQNKYFRELRDCGIIMIDGRLPYQKYMKYFKITQTQQNGKWYQVAVINAKGQAYLAKRHTQWLERQSALELIELELPAIV